MTPEEVAVSFVEAINSKQIDKLSELMTKDHVFINSDGTEYLGRERMSEGWVEYFAMVPDYRIEVKETLTRGNTVVLLGIATGTFSHQGTLDPMNHWSVPAAWRAVIDGDRISVWQLYVNTEQMRKILERLGSL